MKRFLFGICFLILGAFGLQAKEILQITDKTTDLEFHSNNVFIFIDSTDELGIEQVKSLDFNHTEDKFLTLSNKASYWLKFPLKTTYRGQKKWVLEILDSHNDLVEIFCLRDDRIVYRAKTGNNVKNKNDLYSHKNHIVDLPMQGRDSLEVFLRFKSDRVTSMLFKIRTNGNFSSYGFKEYYFLGLYYGILLIIMLLNLVLFFFLKEKIYIIYLFYILAWMISSLNDDGIGQHLIWGGGAVVEQFARYLVKPTLIVTYVWYSFIFFKQKGESVVYDKFVLISTGVYLLAHFLELILGTTFVLTTWLMFIPLVKILFDAFRTYNRGYSPAQFFILGNFFIILGLFVRFLQDVSIIQFNHYTSVIGILTVYARNIGVVLEIIALTLALGDRFRFLKRLNEKHQIDLVKGFEEREILQEKVITHLKENETLSKKVNEELEQKVQERTQELEEQSKELELLNEKLKNQAERITEMNRMLDLDNYKLKKEVKEVNSSRLSFKNISYNEFKAIYPDKLSVLRFLDQHKWKDGYECRKCKNAKYCDGNSKFSRRCTKCRYDESITAFTIFHKCKFPLEHAFYIVTKTIRKGENLDVLEISEELDLRKNTVWNFKSKVLATMEYNKKYKGDEDLLVLVVMNPAPKG